MALDFDLAQLDSVEDLEPIEFGVGRDTEDGERFSRIPVDHEVQNTLAEMVLDTWTAITTQEFGEGGEYSPSDKHGSTEYLTVGLDSPLADWFGTLYHATFEPDAAALSEPAEIFCYFARVQSGDGRKVLGVRRATQFKGILKAQGRLLRWIDDSFYVVEDEVFKLDEDFDLLVDSSRVHILRPTGFELLGQLQQVILAGVVENVRTVQADLSYVDFSTIEAYARTHPRAARYLASISSQGGALDIDRRLLVRVCRTTGVDIQSNGNGVSVPAASVLGFLEVLDRRRFEIELVQGTPERYRATGRSKIPG